MSEQTSALNDPNSAKQSSPFMDTLRSGVSVIKDNPISTGVVMGAAAVFTQPLTDQLIDIGTILHLPPTWHYASWATMFIAAFGWWVHHNRNKQS